VTSVWRCCDFFEVYSMWGMFEENVTCLDLIICGYCVESVRHVSNL
jgi:hypothetical protein